MLFLINLVSLPSRIHDWWVARRQEKEGIVEAES